MMRPWRDPSRAVILLAAALFIVAALPYRFIGNDGQAWRSAVNSDGEGYYAYLTGIFVQGGLAHAQAPEGHFTPAGDGRVIQYYCGTPILQAPFFLLAHGYALCTGQVGDGKGFPYQLAIGVAALFHLLLGLWAIRSLLLAMGIPNAIAAATMLVILLGTGILYYAVVTPAMSHVYGFAMVALTLREARRAWDGGSFGMQRTSAALALTILVRPTHALLLFALPVVTLETVGALRAWVRAQPCAKWFFAVSIGVAILCLQPLLWYLQCHRWWVDPYAGEGFMWSLPHDRSILFGARKGLFFYWPLLLISIPGLWVVLRRSLAVGLLLLFTLALVVHITGCWWSWYYGYGYGMRPLLDLLPLLAVPMALAMQLIPPIRRSLMYAVMAPFMALQLFQLWQFQVGIIHPFNMDREKYAMIFLRSGDRWRNCFGWANMAAPYAQYGMQEIAEQRGDADHGDTLLLSPRGMLVIRQGPTPPGSVLYAEISFRRKALDIGASNDAQIGYAFRKNGQDRAVSLYPLNDIRLPDDRRWRRWTHKICIPPAEYGEQLVVYFTGPPAGSVLLTDIHFVLSATRAAPGQ